MERLFLRLTKAELPQLTDNANGAKAPPKIFKLEIIYFFETIFTIKHKFFKFSMNTFSKHKILKHVDGLKLIQLVNQSSENTLLLCYLRFSTIFTVHGNEALA
jgi:hypothetical protein